MSLVVICEETDCAPPGTAAAVLSNILQERRPKSKAHQRREVNAVLTSFMIPFPAFLLGPCPQSCHIIVDALQRTVRWSCVSPMAHSPPYHSQSPDKGDSSSAKQPDRLVSLVPFLLSSF